MRVGLEQSSLKVYTNRISFVEVMVHHHTRVFKSGNSLAVRIPKTFHLADHQEVEVFMRNNELVIRVVPKNLADAFLTLTAFPDDVLADAIVDLPPQKRDF